MNKFSQITNSIELLQLMKRLFPRYDCLVLPIDKLKAVTPKMKQLIIINFQKSNQTGTHWALLDCHDPRWVIYFDSFAVPPPEEILQFMRRYKQSGIVKDLIMTTKRVQTMKDSYCGYACLLLADLVINKKMQPWEANDYLSKKRIISFGKSLWKKYLME